MQFGQNDAPAFGQSDQPAFAGKPPAFGAGDAPAFGGNDQAAFPSPQPSVEPAPSATGPSRPQIPFAPLPNDLQPGEQSLLDYHRKNLNDGTYLDDEGGLTTVYITGVSGPDNRIYNVPGYVDGRRMDGKEASEYWNKKGFDGYPSYATGPESNEAAQRLHLTIDQDSNLFNNYRNYAPVPESVTAPSSGMTRMESAGQSVVRGFGDTIASIPKAAGVLETAIQRKSAEMVGIDPDEAGITPENSSAYQLGEDLTARNETAFKPDPRYQGEFLTDTLASGAGSMAGFVATGAAGRLIKVPAWFATAFAGAAVGGAGGYEDARQHRAEIGDRYQSFFLNAGLGLGEAVPIAHALDRVNDASGGGVTKILKAGFTGGLEELIQEVTQSIGGNLVARDIVGYDPGRGYIDGAPEAGAAGFTLGWALNTLTSALGSAISGRRGRGGASGRHEASPPPPSSREQLKDVLDDPRTVDEMRADEEARATAQEKADAETAATEDHISNLADEEARQHVNIPSRGSHVTVTVPGGEVFSGTVGDAAMAGDGSLTFILDTGNDELIEFDAEEVQISTAAGSGTQADPVKAETSADVDVAAQQAETEPTDGQKEAGNYQKGHVQFKGLDVTIENPRGSTRSGVDGDGTPWSVDMIAHYGYVKRTNGADGDQVDVYLGVDDNSDQAFIFDQYDPETGTFDEHKVVMGASNLTDAQYVYDAHFNDGTGPMRRGGVTPMSIDSFRQWLKDGDTRNPVAPVASEVAASVERPATTPEQFTVPGDATPSPTADPDPHLPYVHAAEAMLAKKKTGKVTIRMLMNQLGIDKDVALRLHGHLVNRRQLTHKGYIPKPRTKPRTVIDIIKEMGGLQPGQRGEVESRDLRIARPGLIVGAGKGGRSLQDISEHLREIEMLPPDATDDQALVLIDEELNGNPRYHPDDSDLLNTMLAQQDAEAEQDEIQRLNDEIDGLGQVSDEYRAAIHSLVQKGMEVDDAIETVFIYGAQVRVSEYDSFVESEAGDELERDVPPESRDRVSGADSAEGGSLDADQESGADQGDSEGTAAAPQPVSKPVSETGPERTGATEGVSGDHENIVLVKSKKKGWQGVQPAEVSVIQQPDGSWNAGYGYYLGNSGVATPPDSGMNAPTRQGAIDNATSTIVENLQAYIGRVDAGGFIHDEGDVKNARRIVAELRPVTTTEKIDTVDGKRDQGVIEGAERVSGRENLERQMEVGKKAEGEQQGTDGLTLFDPDANMKQDSLLDSPPPQSNPDQKLQTPAQAGVSDSGQPKPASLSFPDKTHSALYEYGQRLTIGGQIEPGTRRKIWDALHGFVENQGETAPFSKPAHVDLLAVDYFNETEDTGASGSVIDPMEQARYAVAVKDYAPQFSRGASSGRSASLSAEEANAVIERITTRWNRENAVELIPRFSDLPAAIKGEAARQDVPKTAPGVLYQGTAYIIHDNVSSERDIEETIFHEVYGHYGIRALLGKQGATALRRLFKALGDMEGIRKLAPDHFNVDEYLEGYESAGYDADTRNALITDELLAHIAQKNERGVKRALKEFIGAIRRWLRSRGFAKLASATEADLLDLLRRARKAAQGRGEAVGLDGPVFSRRTDPDEPQGRMGDEPLATLPDSAARKKERKPRERPEQGAFSLDFFFESRTVRDFLSDHRTPLFDRLRGAVSVLTTELRQKFQDKFIQVRKLQDSIARQTGSAIGEAEDVYLAEELYYGRTGKRLDDFKEKILVPLLEMIEGEGLSLEDVELFLYARHATERNAQIARINPEMPDGGSGMKNGEAGDVLAAFAASGKSGALNRVGDLVSQMNEQRLDIMLDSGLIDESTARRWRELYPGYVPLRGFEHGNEIFDDAPDAAQKTGRGYDVRGNESKRALGRNSKAADILANMVAMHEEAIVRSEKNKVAQTFLRLVQQNPDPNLWEINERAFVRRIDKGTGLVEWRPDPFFRNKENVVAVKVGGKVHYITVHHKGLLRAMKNMGAETMHGFFRALAAINRYLAFVNTSLNPEFVISNFLRDIQTAGINLQQHRVKGLTRQIMRDIPKALAGSFENLRGKHATKWQKYFDEYSREGGKIAFFGLEDLATRKSRIEALLKDLDPSRPRQALIMTREVKELIGDVNSAVENAVRLSTYVNLRKHGASKAKAASVARNLTVNFNRKGELGAQMNSLYLFFNASIQGTAVVFRALHHKRVRRVVGGIVLLNIGLELLNAYASPEDDDERKAYDKITSWTKDHNLILMNPFATSEDEAIALKIPLPYGYNVFHVLGRNIGEQVRRYTGDNETGLAGPMTGALRVVLAAVDSFNPIGSSPTFGQFFTPTQFKVATQIGENKNFMGIPIYPPDDPYEKVPKPDSEKYFRSASITSRAVASTLNEITGGNSVRSGSIGGDDFDPSSGIDTSFSPETLDHVFDFFTGGAGMFVRNTGDFVAQKLRGKDVEWRSVPFARKVVEGRNQWADRERYLQIRTAALTAHKEQDVLRSEGKVDEANKAREGQELNLSMKSVIDQSEKRLRDLRKQRRRAEQIKDEIKREATVEKINDAMLQQMRSVSRAFNQRRRESER